MPDYGHLQPLLKIADVLAAAGFSVECYIAEECAPLMARFDFDYHEIASSEESKNIQAMRQIFAGGIFFNAVCLYLHTLFMYPRVAASVAASAGALKRALEAQQPDLVIADGLWFTEIYGRLATWLGSPLVLNSLDGSLAYAQTRFVQIYGLSTLPPVVQTAVGRIAAIATTLCASVHRARHVSQWLKVRAARRQVRAAFAAAFPLTAPRIAEPTWMVSGTAPLERQHLGGILRTATATRAEFGPVAFRSKLALPDALKDWLDADVARPVVYVSFGSAVDLDHAFARAIYEGLRHVPARALWRLPANQQSLLQGAAPAGNVRIEAFVPQAEILEHPRVRCFVTQAGPHSVQEALFGGTPMLCIPFFVDQAYNSSVVQRLGAGRRLWRAQISPARVEAEIRAILTQATYSERAAALSGECWRNEASSSIVGFLTELIGRRWRNTAFAKSSEFRASARSGIVAH